VLEKWKQRAGKLKWETYALYLAYGDPRTPWYARVFAALVVGYAFSPIDLVPDFIPVLGYLDDLILVPLGVTLAVKMIPSDVMDDCRAQAEEARREGKPISWAAAAVIVAAWVGALVLVAWLVVGRIGR
jgi:uncharacterized membrane protein YkvA (DUF1232 family)